jgi:predicted amidohydrolase
MQDLKITFIQADLVWKEVSANLETFQKKISDISEETDLIILPEMFNTGFVVKPHEIETVVWKSTLEWMKSIAAEKAAVLTGSMIVKEQGKYYNRLYWVHPDGSFSSYDKRHLFSLGGEHLQFTAGNDALVLKLKGWKIKPLICYDLRFPVWAKNNYQSGKYDYDVLIYMANWPAARSHAWKSLLVARAIENQAYTIGVNRIGCDGNGTPHQGFSGVIEPKGEWISEVAMNVESVQTIELSAVELLSYRKKFMVGLDWDQFHIDV